MEENFIKETPLAAVTPPKTLPGLSASIYRGNWNELPDWSKEKPSCGNRRLQDRTSERNAEERLRHSLEWLSSDPPRQASIPLQPTSDDASALRIDNKPLLIITEPMSSRLARGRSPSNRDGTGSASRTATMRSCLEKGKGDGSWSFGVQWAPPGGGLAAIPDALLARDAATPAAVQPPSITAASDQLRFPDSIMPSLIGRPLSRVIICLIWEIRNQFVLISRKMLKHLILPRGWFINILGCSACHMLEFMNFPLRLPASAS